MLFHASRHAAAQQPRPAPCSSPCSAPSSSELQAPAPIASPCRSCSSSPLLTASAPAAQHRLQLQLPPLAAVKRTQVHADTDDDVGGASLPLTRIKARRAASQAPRPAVYQPSSSGSSPAWGQERMQGTRFARGAQETREQQPQQTRQGAHQQLQGEWRRWQQQRQVKSEDSLPPPPGPPPRSPPTLPPPFSDVLQHGLPGLDLTGEALTTHLYRMSALHPVAYEELLHSAAAAHRPAYPPLPPHYYKLGLRPEPPRMGGAQVCGLQQA